MHSLDAVMSMPCVLRGPARGHGWRPPACQRPTCRIQKPGTGQDRLPLDSLDLIWEGPFHISSWLWFNSARAHMGISNISIARSMCSFIHASMHASMNILMVLSMDIPRPGFAWRGSGGLSSWRVTLDQVSGCCFCAQAAEPSGCLLGASWVRTKWLCQFVSTSNRFSRQIPTYPVPSRRAS